MFVCFFFKKKQKGKSLKIAKNKKLHIPLLEDILILSFKSISERQIIIQLKGETVYFFISITKSNSSELNFRVIYIFLFPFLYIIDCIGCSQILSLESLKYHIFFESATELKTKFMISSLFFAFEDGISTYSSIDFYKNEINTTESTHRTLFI